MEIEEYRKKMLKEVTLPSGFNVTIRKLPLSAVTKMSKLFKFKGVATNIPRDELMEHMDELIEILIPQCVVRPRIVTENPAPKGALSLQELEWSDSLAIIDEIIEFGGLSEEDAKARKFFRGKRFG